jgi:hypothetical protein
MTKPSDDTGTPWMPVPIPPVRPCRDRGGVAVAQALVYTPRRGEARRPWRFR